MNLAPSSRRRSWDAALLGPGLIPLLGGAPGAMGIPAINPGGWALMQQLHPDEVAYRNVDAEPRTWLTFPLRDMRGAA